MIKDKYKLAKLPTTDEFLREKRLVQERGELVLVTDGPNFKHITYFTINPGPGYCRGAHYHKKKTEHFYIICGEIEVSLKDMETGQREKLVITTADKLTIYPNCAHIFLAVQYAQVIEYYDSVYDKEDEFVYRDFN